jgi:hypothetical protein
MTNKRVGVRADALTQTSSGEYIYIERKYSPLASYTENQAVVIPELVKAGDAGMWAEVGTRSGRLSRGQKILVEFQGDVWDSGPVLHACTSLVLTRQSVLGARVTRRSSATPPSGRSKAAVGHRR